MADTLTSSFQFNRLDFGEILTGLINIDSITDIELRCGEVWIVDIKKGRYKLDLSSYSEKDRKELNALLRILPAQLAIRMEVAYNEGNPILDAEADYENMQQLRINAIHERLTGGIYPGIAIRKTTYGLRLSEKNINDDEYATEDFLNLCSVLLKSGCHVMITGITGSGKTELLKYIARYIRDNEAIITIEDTFEAYLKRIYPEKEVLSLKSTENESFSDLIKACLRQNPDWIIVSETRGEEVKDLLEAVGTGHHLISTIHSESAEKIPWRMLDMAKVEGEEANLMLRQIHQNINIGIYIHYYNDEKGSHRKVTEVCEFYLDEKGNPKSHAIYEYDFAEGVFIADKIKSSTIISKIRRSKLDVSSLKGVFI